jgi:hypothetical protein
VITPSCRRMGFDTSAAAAPTRYTASWQNLMHHWSMICILKLRPVSCFYTVVLRFYGPWFLASQGPLFSLIYLSRDVWVSSLIAL